MTASTPMPSPRSATACGGIGGSTPSAGGGIPTTAGVGAGAAGTTRGITTAGRGIIRIGTIRGIRGRVIGGMLILTGGLMTRAAITPDVPPCHVAHRLSFRGGPFAAALPFAAAVMVPHPFGAWSVRAMPVFVVATQV